MTDDPELTRVGMLVQGETAVSDIANILEAENMLEYLYALVATGQSLAPVAEGLRIPLAKINLIIQSTPDRRRRNLEAMVSSVATDGVFALSQVSTLTEFTRGQASAATHHRGMIDTAAKLLSRDDAADTGPKVVVHNTVTIGENKAPPPLPPELQGLIIDGTSTVKKEN